MAKSALQLQQQEDRNLSRDRIINECGPVVIGGPAATSGERVDANAGQFAERSEAERERDEMRARLDIMRMRRRGPVRSPDQTTIIRGTPMVVCRR